MGDYDPEYVSPDEVALQTIELLEPRLRRLEYFITGGDLPRGAISDTHTPADVRLTQLERDFERLCTKSQTVQDILQLHTRFPEIFEPIPPHAIPASLSSDELRAVVMAHADRFPTLASRLKSIFEMPVPPVEASMALIKLQPRIDALEELQLRQGEEFLRLQKRSAALLERWYTVFIMGGNECWAEWDTRLTRAERAVKRAEVARERERVER